VAVELAYLAPQPQFRIALEDDATP
jgi:hypothetical protein